MVKGKRKAYEVITLTPGGPTQKWIKTDLWEEKSRVVVKEEMGREEETVEGPITRLPPELLDAIFTRLPHRSINKILAFLKQTHPPIKCALFMFCLKLILIPSLDLAGGCFEGERRLQGGI